MWVLDRQEAERLFAGRRVVSSRVEHDGGELRIDLEFADGRTLVLGYDVRNHRKRYSLKEA